MVKKLAVFCDGTWNDLRMASLTNVARLAKCVAPFGEHGVPQIVYYDDGVGVASNVSPGVDRLISVFGGAFGRGLDRKVEATYRFLVMNYEIEDDIYIFGFSRGAYTARSLCGMIRKCGIVRRQYLDRVPEATELYRNPCHPMAPQAIDFRRHYSHARTAGDEDVSWAAKHTGHEESGLNVASYRRVPETRAELFQYRHESSYRMMYLGVWDTVGSLGVPKRFRPLQAFNRKYLFHDTSASTLIASIRHAVAIEEDRRVFDVSPIDNIFDLNVEWALKSIGNWNLDTPGHPNYVPYNHRPYQQVWFPGGHGAVGGGSAALGLPSAALLWVAEGAHHAGLTFRTDSPPTELDRALNAVNPVAEWRVDKRGKPQPRGSNFLGDVGGYEHRLGPRSLDEVSLSAKVRWYYDPDWRPKNLAVLKMMRPPVRLLPPPPAGFPASPRFPWQWPPAL